MNRLFVGFKPNSISSSAYLSVLKKKYKAQKAGYSGTLDPFAKGVLIIAFGQFTKLFRFLDKSPKIYEATLWFGANSLSLDTNNIIEVNKIEEFRLEDIQKELLNLQGELIFTPPNFSAKRINGKRAYEFAKRGQEVELKKCKMQIYDCKIISYIHPFLTLKLSVSEGAYIRSFAQILASNLHTNATLSNLERLSEGKFIYKNEEALNVLDYLNVKANFLKDTNKLENGAKLSKEDLEFKDDGIYFIEEVDFFSIIEIKDEKVKYILNKLKK